MYAVEHIGGVRGFSGTRDAGLSPGGATDVDPDPEDPHAVDEQLTAILEVIRSWDWRAGIFADDGMRHGEVESTGRHALVEPSNRATPNVEPPSVTPTPLLATAAAAEMSAGPTLPTAPTSPVPEPTVAPAAPAPPQFFAVRRTPQIVTSAAAALSLSASTSTSSVPASVDLAPPAIATPPVTDVAASATAAVGGVAAGRTRDQATAHSGGTSQPQRWRVACTLLLGAAVIVVIIVAIARSNGPGSSAEPPSFRARVRRQPPVHVSSTVLTEFTTISKTLDAANVAASKALASGS